MIRSFKDSETESVINRTPVRKFALGLQRRARRKLIMVDDAENLNDLRVPPGNHLEKLEGDRRGQHCIRINRQWRICFVWQDGDAYEVEIVDYH